MKMHDETYAFALKKEQAKTTEVEEEIVEKRT